MSLKTYWGDMHTQFNLAHMRLQTSGVDAVAEPPDDASDCEAFVRQAFEGAREYLDFFPIVYYPAHFYETPEGLKTESVGMRDYFKPDWEMICRLVREYHEPGRFVTFAGYEWTGDRTRWGDHNVFYPFDDPPLDLSMTIDELYANLRAVGGIAIPHHVAYSFGNRAKDWDHYDEQVSPLVEIYSVHGSSEGCNTPIGMVRNGSMAPRVSGCSVQDGLARGYRLGIIASGDNGQGFAGKWGIGLMAARATELTREAIWDALLNRRVYAVTGDRIKLDYSIEDAVMGSVIEASGPVTLQAAVEGTQALDRVEVIRNNRVVFTHCHNGTWEPPDGGTVRCKVAFEFGWGPAPHYGLQVSDRVWEGRLLAQGMAVRSVEGCFTRHGNRWEQVSDSEVHFHLTTSPRRGAADDTAQQTLVFEIEGPVDGTVRFECDGESMEFTLARAMRESGLTVFHEQVKALIREQFGLGPDDFENPADTYYHNAWKIKRHMAVPEAGYRAEVSWTDEAPAPGRNWYYLRISQLNGQYAWSSPVWVDNGR
ncbi:MAG: DUF3604 domain-containing protein [Armatimonadetes bacterium]|nr:DUF3604 domain-containing protein [Armatimonadota bacterium]